MEKQVSEIQIAASNHIFQIQIRAKTGHRDLWRQLLALSWCDRCFIQITICPANHGIASHHEFNLIYGWSCADGGLGCYQTQIGLTRLYIPMFYQLGFRSGLNIHKYLDTERCGKPSQSEPLVLIWRADEGVGLGLWCVHRTALHIQTHTVCFAVSPWFDCSVRQTHIHGVHFWPVWFLYD